MKRCPQCNRVETDDALVFCRADGTALVTDSSSLNSEAGTASLDSASGQSEIETSILPHTTDAAINRGTGPTAALPAESTATTSALAKPKRRRIAITIAIIAVAVVVIGAGLYKLFNRSQPRKAISFASAKITRLTTTGKASNVAISPDGKYVVHVQDDGGRQSLWTRQVATQSNVEIVAPAAVNYNSLTFSPDGNYIYYNVFSPDISQRALFQVPTLGGAPKKLLVNLDVDTVSFSSDGKQFAFIRKEAAQETTLMIANRDGTADGMVTAYERRQTMCFPSRRTRSK